VERSDPLYVDLVHDTADGQSFVVRVKTSTVRAGRAYFLRRVAIRDSNSGKVSHEYVAIRPAVALSALVRAQRASRVLETVAVYADPRVAEEEGADYVQGVTKLCTSGATLLQILRYVVVAVAWLAWNTIVAKARASRRARRR
jgi:hypothetical protein